jgi:Holliday junction resolvase RusA-like endonuclease
MSAPRYTPDQIRLLPAHNRAQVEAELARPRGEAAKQASGLRYGGAQEPSKAPVHTETTPAGNLGSIALPVGKAGIVLTLPYPPSANAYWRSLVIKGSVRVLVSSEARKYKKLVAELASYTKPRLPGPLIGALRLSLTLYRPIKRGDLSNRIKVIEDALIGIAYADDSQITEIVAKRFDDKTNPRVLVIVEQIP